MLVTHQPIEDQKREIYLHCDNKVSKGPYANEVAKMAIGGALQMEALKFLAAKNAKVSYPTMSAFYRYINGLSIAERNLIADVATVNDAEGVCETEAVNRCEDTKLTNIQVLIKMMGSVAGRIAALEAGAKDGLLSEKNEQQLREYYVLYMEYRKDLEKERVKSEVSQAQRQLLVNVGHEALNFIPDPDMKRKFIQKVRALEKSLGLVD